MLLSFNGNKKKNDLEWENLKGKVKRVITVGYSVKKVQTQIQKDTIYYYFIEEYDSLGNTVNWKSCNKKDTAIIKYILKYDGLKNVVELIQYKNNKLALRKSFGYDSLGSRIEERGYDTNNLLFGRAVFKYNNLGDMIKWYEYIGHYDTNGKTIQCGPNGVLMYIHSNKFDDKGNKISEEANSPDGSFDSKYVYKYDDKGNQIKYSDLSSKGKLRDNRIYQYFNFDKHDNWQKEIYSNNDKPLVIIERQLEYYQ